MARIEHHAIQFMDYGQGVAALRRTVATVACASDAVAAAVAPPAATARSSSGGIHCRLPGSQQPVALPHPARSACLPPPPQNPVIIILKQILILYLI